MVIALETNTFVVLLETIVFVETETNVVVLDIKTVVVVETELSLLLLLRLNCCCGD